MERLDQILDTCVAKGDKTTKDELLGAAFVVVNKDGELPVLPSRYVHSGPGRVRTH